MQRLSLKSFIKKIIIFVIGILSMLMCVHFIPVDKSNYFASIYDKHKALESTSSPRLIVIGGSNVAFGFDSERLSKNIGIPVINMGIHGALGLKFILNDFFPYIHQNDIIFLIPEYFQFFNNNYAGFGRTLSELLDTYPEGIKSLDLVQIFNVIKEYFPRLRSKIWRVFSENSDDLFYNRYMFNKNGDAIVSSEPARNIGNSPLIKENDRFNPKVTEFLNDFYKKVIKKGANIFFIYPASRITNCEMTIQKLNDLEKTLKESLDFPIYSRPLEACLDEKYFLDTEYHLNKKGIALRMNLMEDLINSNNIEGTILR